MYDRLVTGPNAGTRKAEAELLKAMDGTQESQIWQSTGQLTWSTSMSIELLLLSRMGAQH